MAEQVARHAWTTPYRWSQNLISDLGAVTCGNYPLESDRYICSPLHTVMNTSFIVQGLFIAGGALLLRRLFLSGQLAMTAYALPVVAGLSLSVVGFVPEDVGSPLHGIAAAIHLMSGNLALILFGLCVSRENAPSLAGKGSLVMGAVGLVAILLLGSHHYLGIGPGAMERIGGYPLPLFLTGLGIYLLSSDTAGKAYR